MGRTTIEVDEETRDELRVYKAERGLTYDAAIRELLEAESDAQSSPSVRADADGRPSAVDAELAAVDFPAGRDREACLEAIEAAREFIELERGATMREIVAAVAAGHPCGYDVPDELQEGERYRGAWWRSIVRPGLEALDAIEAPAPGGSEWRPS